MPFMLAAGISTQEITFISWGLLLIFMAICWTVSELDWW